MTDAVAVPAVLTQAPHGEWVLPSRGVVGMVCLIVAEAAIFIIFVVAYVFYIGKSLSGPTPREVLTLPVFATVCLLSSSLTVHLAVSALRARQRERCTLWLGATVTLGLLFLAATAREWYGLIVGHGLTIRTNLFGTTFYSLVGLHATHVVIGLSLLGLALVFSWRKQMTYQDAERLNVLSYYWHFVDAVWVVVFLVVYVVGR